MKRLFIHGSRYIVIVLFVGSLLIASLAWNYLQLQEIRRDSISSANQQKQAMELQRLLLSERKANSDLQEELQLLGGRLENTETSLNEILSMNWQEQYQELQLRHREYKQETMAQLQSSENEEARLQRALQFLQAENLAIKKQLADSAVVEKETRADIEQLLTEKEQALQQVAKLETQLQESRQAVETKTQIQTQSQPQKTAGSDVEDIRQYRSMRIQSLRGVLADRDSPTRRSILIDVIPTIPSGLGATELLPLVAGMNSEDILAVIQASNQYIKRPINNRMMSALAATMNEEDAVAASLILANQ